MSVEEKADAKPVVDEEKVDIVEEILHDETKLVEIENGKDVSEVIPSPT